jgi:hypothetical protein
MVTVLGLLTIAGAGLAQIGHRRAHMFKIASGVGSGLTGLAMLRWAWRWHGVYGELAAAQDRPHPYTQEDAMKPLLADICRPLPGADKSVGQNCETVRVPNWLFKGVVRALGRVFMDGVHQPLHMNAAGRDVHRQSVVCCGIHEALSGWLGKGSAWIAPMEAVISDQVSITCGQLADPLKFTDDTSPSRKVADTREREWHLVRKFKDGGTIEKIHFRVTMWSCLVDTLDNSQVLSPEFGMRFEGDVVEMAGGFGIVRPELSLVSPLGCTIWRRQYDTAGNVVRKGFWS